MESYGLLCNEDGHPSPDPKSHQDVNELVTAVENTSKSPSRGATRPQTIAPGRAERREKTLDTLRRATVIIDLTNDDTSPSPAATRTQTIAPDTPRSPTKDLTDDWERLAVLPTSLILALKDGRCTNDNGGIDLHSIAEVVLKPSIGYPARYHLFRDSRDGFTGKYGEDETGIISLDLREVEAMIQPERREGGFFADVWSPE